MQNKNNLYTTHTKLISQIAFQSNFDYEGWWGGSGYSSILLIFCALDQWCLTGAILLSGGIQQLSPKCQ